MHTYVWISIIFLFAGFTQGVSGFGSILLSLPLLALFLDIKVVIPLTALAGVSMSVILFVQLRRHFDWNKILPILLGALPGVPVGVFFLKKMDRGTIHWILGILLVVYSLYGLLLRSPRKGIDQRWGYAFGFFGGCLGGALSAGGPPVIVYTSLQKWSKDQIKVTIQGFFLSAGPTVILMHVLSGLTTPIVLRFYAVSLPVLVLGTYLGSLLYGIIREEHYKKLVFILLGFLGLFMIYRA